MRTQQEWERPWDGVTAVSSPGGPRGGYVATTVGGTTGAVWREESDGWRHAASFPSGVTAGPVVADDRWIVGTLDGRLVAHTADDRVVWERRRRAALPTAPVGADPLIVVDFRGQVTAVEPATGQRRWTTRIDGVVDSSPTVADDTVYVAGTEQLAAVALGDGRCRWSTDCQTLLSPVPVAGGVVVAASDGTIRRVGTDGTTDWTVRTDRSVVQLAVHRTCVAATHDGTVVRLSPSDGAIRNRWTIPARPVALGTVGDRSVVCSRNHCWRLSDDDTTHRLWTSPIPVDGWRLLDDRLVGAGTIGVVVRTEGA